VQSAAALQSSRYKELNLLLWSRGQQITEDFTIMAKGGDQMSILASELERVSTADTLYNEEDVAGNGVGCIASKDIKKGNLILREIPVLLTDVRDGPATIASVEEIIGAFVEMLGEDQEKYMLLYNAYYGENTNDQWISQWSNETTMDISKDQASKVWNIYCTNSFHNGVCLKMSRFNHSCCSNAQYFWNVDTHTRDIRAMRKIKQGEEITVNYQEVNWAATKEERQTLLKKAWNFDCHCKACDATEAEIKNNDSLCKLYNEENWRKDKFEQNGLMDKEAECVKQMYRLAKDMKTFSRKIVLQSIVQEAFNVTCQGAMSEQFSRNREEVKAAWMKDAKTFATIGLRIATTLFGEHQSTTQEWKARSSDPVKFFLKEHNGAFKYTGVP
jgi:hypothetical protein